MNAEEWARSASAYIYDLGEIQPFLAGNEIVLHEFVSELARKNNLSLQWCVTSDLASDSIAHLSHKDQSANLRRLIMLAMDTDPIVQHSNRVRSVVWEMGDLPPI